MKRFEDLHRAGHRIELSDVQDVLRDSNEWWKVIFEAAGLAMAVGNVQGEIYAVTPSFQKVFGYDEKELRDVGGVMAMTHPDDLPLDMELFGELVAGERDHYQMEKRYYRKDGSLMWGRLTVLLLRGEENDTPVILAMVQDVTETRQANELAEQLRMATLKREQAIELNDNIVQGLVVAKMAFESGVDEKVAEALTTTLEKAREIVGDLLGELGIEPGSLVRGEAAETTPPPAPAGGSIP